MVMLSLISAQKLGLRETLCVVAVVGVCLCVVCVCVCVCVCVHVCVCLCACICVQKGYADGEAAAARFNWPTAVVVDMEGTIVVADTHNHCLRRLTGRHVTTLAGGSCMTHTHDTCANAHTNTERERERERARPWQ
jgi:hypothetical protein